MDDKMKKLVAMEADVKSRLAAMEAREAKHDQVVVDFKARVARVDEKEKMLKGVSSELNSLSETLAEQAEKNEKMKGYIKNKTNEIEESIKEVSLAKTEADKVKKELVAKESDYKAEIKELKAENEKLMADLARTTKKMSQLSQRTFS